MKNLSLLFIVLFSINSIVAQEESTQLEKDNWSGRYRLEIRNGDSIIDQPLVYVSISQAADINPDNEAVRYRSDIKRWSIMTEGTNDEVIIRRFLFDLEDGENEYDQFGWTELYEEGKMECIDAGHFFICKTTPNTTVNFGDEESAFIESGIFGIRLHLGLFLLYPVKE